MKYKNWVLFVLGAAVITVGIALGSTFLSKDSDDETIYTALAVKIQATGASAYNLHDLSIDSVGDFWKISYMKDGSFLPLLVKSGATYYDTQFYFNPPLFPAILALSHEIFNGPLNFLLLRRNQAPEFHFEQFYAAFPNALFLVLFLVGVFFLGKMYFDKMTGLLAVLFCLISPVLLVTTFKVWSDLMCATLILYSFLCWKGKNRSLIRVVLSGVLFGLAILTRTSAIFAIFIFFTREWKSLLLWIVSVFLVTGAWFCAVFQNYGTFFYFPEVVGAKESLAWLRSITRPWFFYIADLIYLSPGFLLTIFAIQKKTRVLFWWPFCTIVPLSILLYTKKPLGLEDRYLLPCYPALAVLAAKTVVDFSDRIPRWVIYISLFLVSAWSLRLAGLLVLSRESLRFVPLLP